MNVCTTDDFTKSVDALVYYIDPDNEEMKIAYPTLLFDRNITDGRGMMCSFLTLAIGNNQGKFCLIRRWLEGRKFQNFGYLGPLDIYLQCLYTTYSL